MKKNKKHGFTLIELMIVVAIIGILAAVAIPAFINYMKRAKTSEATLNLKSIVEGAVSYYDTHNQRLPLSTNLTPSTPAPSAQTYKMSAALDAATEFGSEAWQQVGWKPHKDFYYQYTWDNPASVDETLAVTSDTVIGTAQAVGDLDGDSTQSSFTRTVVKIATGLAKPTEVVVNQELE